MEIVIILFLLVFVGLPFVIRSREIGVYQTAGEWDDHLTTGAAAVGGGLILLVAAVYFTPRSMMNVAGALMIGGIAVMVPVAVARRFMHGRQAGATLLKLRWTESIQGFVPGLLMALLGVYWVAYNLVSSNPILSSQTLGATVFGVALLILRILSWFYPVKITPAGILTPFALVKWSNIEGYAWRQRRRPLLILTILHNGRFFPGSYRQEFFISPDKKEEVERLLQQYLNLNRVSDTP